MKLKLKKKITKRSKTYALTFSPFNCVDSQFVLSLGNINFSSKIHSLNFPTIISLFKLNSTMSKKFLFNSLSFLKNFLDLEL